MSLEHEHHDENLRQQLAALSVWPPTTPAPQVWKRVAPQSYSGWRRLIQRPLPGTLMGGLAAVLVLALGIGLILPSLSKARSSAKWAAVSASVGYRKELDDDKRSTAFFDREEPERLAVAGELARKRAAFGGESAERAQTPSSDGLAGRSTSPEAARQVIRKATVEMLTRDVRTTFAKVPLILSEAQGEFVQESSMVADTREPDRVTATVVIRVAASRLSKVLGELRELGKVTTESAGGEDVTDQMVDLDARLRNEQRVEKELLALMDTRKDAPLKEIMELRSSLDSVRQGIERMAAQRERIGRLVSLATVMVVIRTDKPEPPAPAPKAEPTLGGRFADAARSGWTNLVGTLTWIVEVTIGGLVRWLIVALCLTLAWRAARRAKRRGAQEHAPIA